MFTLFFPKLTSVFYSFYEKKNYRCFTIFFTFFTAACLYEHINSMGDVNYDISEDGPFSGIIRNGTLVALSVFIRNREVFFSDEYSCLFFSSVST